MEEKLIARINELARKEKAEGLTPEEKKEQSELRAKYIEAYRASLRGILENTYIQRPDGTKEKLSRNPKKRPPS